MLVKLKKNESTFNTSSILSKYPDLEVLEIMAKHPVSLTIDLSQAKNLKKLYLYGSTKNCSINSCTALEKLEILKVRGFTSAEVINLADHANTQILQLAHCGLRTLPTWCCQLAQLHTLELQGNSLEDLPNEFEWLIRLKRLNLDKNLFKYIPRVLLSTKNLNHLSIDGNEIAKDEFNNFITNLNI